MDEVCGKIKVLDTYPHFMMRCEIELEDEVM